ncbi:hypothetical protein PUV47_01395 [Pseudovibrio exalbescens]|uniref:hypothetical protein n=1 Tax=Pseudovibrio exalbescens TaxID=197461 RepID=UPI002366A3FC|nr:hypothetical protein [Pseudovibrio exalbescens]MDD7908556.1 hypothetical protein [Pseudovibrio exalbescens]
MTTSVYSIATSRTHWRGGQFFVQGKKKELTVPDQISDEQLRQIKADPELLVELVGELSHDALKPSDLETRLLTIQKAVFALPGGKDAFTKAGTPRVSVLEDAIGWKPEADEIEQAIEALSDQEKADLKAVLEG